MDNIDRPTERNSRAYLLVENGLVEDLGSVFTELTGYSKEDFYHRHISEVMERLLGKDHDVDMNTSADYYLLTKFGEVTGISVFCPKTERANQKLYYFRPYPDFELNSGMSLVNKLVNDTHLGAGLYSCPDFRLLKANLKYLNYLRDNYHLEEDPLGAQMNGVIRGFNESKWKKQLQKVCDTGETVCLKELQTISMTGEIRYWNETITSVAENGRVKYIISILDEVTDQVLKRKYLEDKNEELKRMIEMKDEMLLLITHELKTPMSIITSSIQALEIVCKNELTDKVRKYLNKIKQNTYRQLKLVNNILDNTRANSGIFKMNRVNADAVHLTRTLIDTISVFAERKRIKISFTTEMERSIICVDVDIFERILLNLLSNAVKFTPEEKTIEVSIYKTVLKARKQVCIQVRDYGIGIPSDQKDLIFKRFGRVERVVARQSEGTGIGLYLVKTLVSLLDGQIKVESKEGIGSTFSLFFPLLKDTNAEPSCIEKSNDNLMTASVIEFSDIYYGA